MGFAVDIEDSVFAGNTADSASILYNQVLEGFNGAQPPDRFYNIMIDC